MNSTLTMYSEDGDRNFTVDEEAWAGYIEQAGSELNDEIAEWRKLNPGMDVDYFYSDEYAVEDRTGRKGIVEMKATRIAFNDSAEGAEYAAEQRAADAAREAAYQARTLTCSVCGVQGHHSVMFESGFGGDAFCEPCAKS